MDARAPVLVVSLALVGACTPSGPAGGSARIDFAGSTMGTTYAVRVDDAAAGTSDREQRQRELADAIEAALESVDRLMSTYRDDSEISALNRAPVGQTVPVSPATVEVLGAALGFAADSGGAFDATAGALVNAWGFGPAGTPVVPPSEPELVALRASVGSRYVVLDPTGSTAARAHPLTYVDLSAIAKGFAVDAIADALAARGHESFLVEVGGEVRTRGHTAAEETWRVGIERPAVAGSRMQRWVEIVDGAVATSGNYRNSYVYEGIEIGHTIDPRTGYPVRHQGAAVTVLAERCITADALATTLMVMGPVEGLAWAEERGIAALFLVRSDDGFTELATRAFDAYSTDRP